MFSQLPLPPEDPILGLSQRFADDRSTQKVDLGIGVYKDARGQVPVLNVVKQAESRLLSQQSTKGYLSSVGNPEFNRLTGGLLLGSASEILQRSQTMQCPGGTGALRVAGDLLHKLRPGGGRIFVPTPTWANHRPLFAAAGLEVLSYPYYDPVRGELRFDAMLDALGELTADDALLLHGCCHNPSGADLDRSQWSEVARLLDRTGALPLVDLAYQGFAGTPSEDAQVLTHLATQLPEVLVASSYSKNFALYRERVGALTVIGASRDDAERARAHAVTVARTNYSMPPDHGGAIVACVLGDARLRAEWEEELREMRERIQAMRAAFVQHLKGRTSRNFGFMGTQRGMFALLGLEKAAVEVLRSEYHVHITSSGRINVAGLTEENVERVAAAIAAVSQGQMV